MKTTAGEQSGGRQRLNERFRRFAISVSGKLGTPTAFILAVTTVVVWAASGPVFGFSDRWQLIINTSTTIITFLMVFLIQNTQNRDTQAMQVKLDELLKGVRGARTSLVGLEELSDDELQELHTELRRIGSKSRREQSRLDAVRRTATGEPSTERIQPSASNANARKSRRSNGGAITDTESPIDSAPPSRRAPASRRSAKDAV